MLHTRLFRTRSFQLITKTFHLLMWEQIYKNQPWYNMLASVNPVTSAVPKSQLAQPDNPEAQVYGAMAEVWPYGLFPAVHMLKRVRVPCVYNYPPWVIRQLTINEVAMLWYVPLLLQEKLEELDKNPCWFNFCHRCRVKRCS